MPNSNQANDVARYAAAVRAALASLPDAERESLLEDLESHLAEVAGESDQSLEERLGKPATYAAELRAAYGAASETRNAPSRARYPYPRRPGRTMRRADSSQHARSVPELYSRGKDMLNLRTE